MTMTPKVDPALAESAQRCAHASTSKVVAVVLNWCGEEDTLACVRSLEESHYGHLQVLIVDNGSPDGSGPRIHRAFPDLPYLQLETNLGYTGGNNHGIRWALASGAEYVLILNNDTVVAPDCVTHLVAAAESDPRAGGVAPKVLFFDEPDRIWYGGGELSTYRALGRHRREGELDRATNEAVTKVSFLNGCCLLLPARVLREIGAFEEDFFAYVEDVELSLRVRMAGYSLLYQPAARVLHRVPPTVAPPSPFQILHRDRNRRRMVRRRYGALHRLGFAAFFYPSRVALAAKYLLQRDWSRLQAVWQGMTLP